MKFSPRQNFFPATIELTQKLVKLDSHLFHGDLRKVSDKNSPMRSTTIRPKKNFALQKSRNFRENRGFSDSIFFSQICPRISRPIFLDTTFDGKSLPKTPELNSFVAKFFRRPKFTEMFAFPQGYSLSPPFPSNV